MKDTPKSTAQKSAPKRKQPKRLLVIKETVDAERFVRQIKPVKKLSPVDIQAMTRAVIKRMGKAARKAGPAVVLVLMLGCGRGNEPQPVLPTPVETRAETRGEWLPHVEQLPDDQWRTNYFRQVRPAEKIAGSPLSFPALYERRGDTGRVYILELGGRNFIPLKP